MCVPANGRIAKLEPSCQLTSDVGSVGMHGHHCTNGAAELRLQQPGPQLFETILVPLQSDQPPRSLVAKSDWDGML